MAAGDRGGSGKGGPGAARREKAERSGAAAFAGPASQSFFETKWQEWQSGQLATADYIDLVEPVARTGAAFGDQGGSLCLAALLDLKARETRLTGAGEAAALAAESEAIALLDRLVDRGSEKAFELLATISGRTSAAAHDMALRGAGVPPPAPSDTFQPPVPNPFWLRLIAADVAVARIADYLSVTLDDVRAVFRSNVDNGRDVLLDSPGGWVSLASWTASILGAPLPDRPFWEPPETLPERPIH